MCSCTQKSLRTAKIEPAVWAFVSDLLQDPEKIRSGMEGLLTQKQATGLHKLAREVKLWPQKIAECSQQRRAFQEQQAAGLMTFEELRERLSKS